MKITTLKTNLLVLTTTVLATLCSCESDNTEVTENINASNSVQTEKEITLSQEQLTALRRRAINPISDVVTEIKSEVDLELNGVVIDDYFIRYKQLNSWVAKDAEASSGKLWIRENRIAIPGGRRRDITVGLVTKGASDEALPPKLVNAIKTAIQRYNALNMRKLRFTTIVEGDFLEISNSGTDIKIYIGNTSGSAALAFFPFNGNPGNRMIIREGLSDDLSQAQLTVIAQHEFGHNLGLRHSDFRNRRSCPAGSKDRFVEPDSNSEPIPGTNASGTSTLSIMRACNPTIYNDFQADDRNSLRRAYNGDDF